MVFQVFRTPGLLQVPTLAPKLDSCCKIAKTIAALTPVFFSALFANSKAVPKGMAFVSRNWKRAALILSATAFFSAANF